MNSGRKHDETDSSPTPSPVVDGGSTTTPTPQPPASPKKPEPVKIIECTVVEEKGEEQPAQNGEANHQ